MDVGAAAEVLIMVCCFCSDCWFSTNIGEKAKNQYFALSIVGNGFVVYIEYRNSKGITYKCVTFPGDTLETCVVKTDF